MRPVARGSVNKSRSVRQFRKNSARTKRANVNTSPRVSSPIASSGGSPRTLASNEKIIQIDEFERLKNCEQELASKLSEITNFEELLTQTNAKHKQEAEEKESQLQLIS